MKDFFKTPLASMISFFLIGCLMMSGMKAVEWLIPAPEKTVNLMVCVADTDGAIGHCKPFTDYVADSGS